MLRVSVTLGKDEWVFGFPQDDVTIGSAPSSSLVLDDASVGKTHARLLRYANGSVLVRTVHPSHQVLVNDVATMRTSVREGDTIAIGVYRLAVLDRDPPGKVELEFLAAIADAPNDDTQRAVYGDWLEEHQHFEEAQFLRAQIEIRDLAADHPRFADLARTIETLAPRMGLTWRRAVARPAIENCGPQFELKCPKRWDELKTTKDPDQRFCDACNRNVHYATTVDKARRLAVAGQCVAVDIAETRRPGDLNPPPPRLMVGRMVAPPARLPPPALPK